MKESNVTKLRKSRLVHPITIEIDDAVYKGLLRYCARYGRSKRRIIEDALNCWIIERDMEIAGREAKE